MDKETGCVTDMDIKRVTVIIEYDRGQDYIDNVIGTVETNIKTGGLTLKDYIMDAMYLAKSRLEPLQKEDK